MLTFRHLEQNTIIPTTTTHNEKLKEDWAAHNTQGKHITSTASKGLWGQKPTYRMRNIATDPQKHNDHGMQQHEPLART